MTEHNHGSGSENGVLQFTPAEYEYNTLMHLLGVSVSKHLLDEHFTLIWANEFYYELIGWPKDEYEAVFHNRPDLYYREEPEEWQKLSDTVLQALAALDTAGRRAGGIPASLADPAEKRRLCLGAVFRPVCG